jgi:hypothetical protein
MRTIFYTAGALLAFVILYLIFQFLVLLKLRQQLINADLKTFKKTLGNNYRFKTYDNGYTKYKWSKGWIVVKAEFDKEGNLKSEIIFLLYLGELYKSLAF